MDIFPEWKVYRIDFTKAQQPATHLNIIIFQELPTLKVFLFYFFKLLKSIIKHKEKMTRKDITGEVTRS